MGTTKKARIEALRGVPLFKTLSQRDLGALAERLTEQHFEAGQVVVREGAGNDLVLVIDGEVALSRRSWHLGRRGPGTVVGETNLIDGAPHDTTVAARTDTVALFLNDREFARALEEAPAFARKILKALAVQLRQDAG
ncbi:MAG: cyclic nucleotide-binding domain-containing protein [Actinobacteria bacterium]|nr:cyclic nucleotide-binding domain-containing protein [Actinomycetota bacterium]